MLNSIRKFSGSPYAKVLLAIVILPFVLWGMGDVFRSGSQNTVLTIGNNKISTQKLSEYINGLNLLEENMNESTFDTALSSFIANQLIIAEAEINEINVSDTSLVKIIKNKNDFKKNNIFSRTKYEKFLITNNLNSRQFEERLRANEIREQLLDFIAGGIKSPKFLISREYDSRNQIRNLLVINLNDIYKNELNYTEQEIKNYYNENIKKFNETYKSIKYTNITPGLITGKEEYNNSFFQKLDEIEDLIISEIGIEAIAKKFNLSIKSLELFNKDGKNISGENIINFDKNLLKDIFLMDPSDPLALINWKDSYMLVKFVEDKIIPRKITEKKIRNEIVSTLKQKKITKKNSDIIEKIIKNKFTKIDFENLAKKNMTKVEKIRINGKNDVTRFKKELVNNIYLLPEKNMYIFSDNNLDENFLIYVNKIDHVQIDNYSQDYEEYLHQTNRILINNIYNTYDKYINMKHKVEINHKATERIKNYFK